MFDRKKLEMLNQYSQLLVFSEYFFLGKILVIYPPLSSFDTVTKTLSPTNGL